MADRSFDFALDKMSTHSDSDSTLSLPPQLTGQGEALDVEKTRSVTTQPSHDRPPPMQRVVTAQDWTGPDDPENPMNWPLSKKIYHTTVPALQCFTITFGSSVYTPGIESVVKNLGVSREVAILPLSVYVLGLAFGPMVSAPLSETFGRRAVYLSIFIPSLLFTMGAGFAQNIGTLLVCRFFAGFFGSGCLAIGAGTNSDLFAHKSRAMASSFFLMAPFLGPALGPPVGGFASQAKGWRWTQWPILFIGAFTYLWSLPQRETYKKIILLQRAKKLDLPPPPNPLPPGLARIKFILLVTVLRPFRMLFTEPIVAYLSIYTAFNFSVLFGFFDAFPLVFGGVYRFNTGEAGLSFLGIGVGVVSGGLLVVLIDRLGYHKKTTQRQAAGITAPLPPEERLYPAMFGAFMLPLGLFWFAWTSRRDVHWISPILATIPFGTGNVMVFVSVVLYLIDTYGPMTAGSAAAANGVLRYVLGAVFPLFTVQMYERLGIAWATSLLGFIAVALMPLPFVFYRFGPAIRSRSAYGTIKPAA